MATVHWSKTFVKLYKKKLKKSPDFVIAKIKTALYELKNSSDPKLLGEMKQGGLHGFRAIELGNKNRLLYSVNQNGEVSLLKVCSHDQVYGK